MRVRVPASSANLGPGFDALGLALDLHAELGIVGAGPEPERARPVDEHHPATIAFRAAGGTGDLWERCPIPSGRGLGFSGAVRVGGAVLAAAQRRGPRDAWRAEHDEILRLVTDLEGHADNVAASLDGGVVVAAAGRVVAVPMAIEPSIVTWIPAFTTSTDESRRALRAGVAFDDAVFNVGRAALFVAALAAGDVAALRSACEDRLHQPLRLAASPVCAAVLRAALDAGAWAAWLSGSGPTVAAMCAPAGALAVASAMESAGSGADADEQRTRPSRTKVLGIDRHGATVVAP